MTTFNDKLDEWFCGNADAVRFFLELWEACQAWDDFADGDNDGMALLNPLCDWLAFSKEYQPFFRQYSELLRPAFLQVYLTWDAATQMERHGNKADLEKTYMLRATLYQVIHLIAWICGGTAHAARVGPDIYRSYGETLADLEKEFGYA